MSVWSGQDKYIVDPPADRGKHAVESIEPLIWHIVPIIPDPRYAMHPPFHTSTANHTAQRLKHFNDIVGINIPNDTVGIQILFDVQIQLQHPQIRSVGHGPEQPLDARCQPSRTIRRAELDLCTYVSCSG